MKKIKIEQLLPLLKSGWVAMDKCGKWWWFSARPFMWNKEWHFKRGKLFCISRSFNIAPFDGDWKDSLIKIDHFHQQGKMVKEEEYIIHIEDFAPPHPTGFMSESQLKRMFEHKEEE